MAKYSKEIVKRITDLISSDSYTIIEICQQVGITKETYYQWLKTKADFSDAIKKAQEQFNELLVVEAKKSLMKGIQGYTVDETKTTYVESKTKELDDDGNAIRSKPKIKEQIVTKKYIQPNPTLIIFTLVNRDPANWKNRQENKLSGEVGIKNNLESLSDEELQKIVNGDT